MALQNVEANITLDLYNYDTTHTIIKAIQLDSKTRYVASMLQNMGAEYGLDSNATVQLIVVRPDKVGVQIVGTTFTYGDESAQFLGPYAELTQVALAVNGKMLGQFKITSGDQILRTEIFTISTGVALDASTDEWADEYDGYNLEEMATSIETNTADIASLEADVSQIKENFTYMVNSAYVTDSASGSIAHFGDGANDVLMKSVKVSIAPVQSGSGDSSPSNVRAISGWDSVKVTRTGKNLLQYPYRSVDGTYQNVTRVTNSDGSVTFNGTANANSYFNFVTEVDKITLKAGTYVLSANEVPQDALISVNVRVNGENKYNVNLSAGNTSVVFTPQEDGYLRCYVTVGSGAVINNWTVYPMLRLASDTDNTYEPYNGNTYDVSLASAGTVYGGTLDAVSGELIVDKAIVDLGTLTWTYEPTIPRFHTNGLQSKISPINNSEAMDGLSTLYKVVSFNELYTQRKENGSIAASNNKIVSIINTAYTDAQSFKTAMVGQTLVYPLATPLTYQLSATEIKSLLGINNVWSDAGDADVEYRADTKLYIDKKLGG